MLSPASTSPTAASTDLSSLPVVGAALMLTEIREAELTSKTRKALPKSAFVYPDDERYPIHDESHAKNALARVAGNGTPAEQKKVKAAVYAKYPSLKPGSESKVKEAETPAPLTAARLAAAGVTVRLRESAFPLLGSYDLSSMMRNAGILWADGQATGNADDEADAASLAKTVKRVIERHPEIVQIGDCGCGPVCCC